MEKEAFDYLGNLINIGDFAIMVGSKSGYFREVVVLDVDTSRRYNLSVQVISDGNKVAGWTTPKRLIVKRALK